MSDWTQGYVAELDYTHGYYRELNPVYLAFVARCKAKRSPDLTGPIAYCELGCGQGYGVNLLAAANPDIQFYANDFNPPQIAGARAVAREGGLSNAHFSDASFQDYIDDPALPAFDFIVMHGIWSWVSEDNRRIIVDFLRRKLKVGGLVHVSYNALPGWTSVTPLRRLLQDHGATAGGTLAERIGKAQVFAGRVKDANAAYFRDLPAAAAKLERVRKQPVNYLAHEYFGRDWSAFYSADVAAALGGAKLDFVGSAWLFDHVDDISLTPAHKAMLGEVADPVFRETVWDYLTMNPFRRDLFGRGPLPLTGEEARRSWLDLRLVLSVPRAACVFSITSRVGTVALKREAYEPVLDALAEGPRSLRQLLEVPAINALGDANLLETIKVLVGSDQVQPCLPLEGEAARRTSAKAFNAAVCRRALSSADLQYLASPVTGGGHVVDQIAQLFLHGLNEKVADIPAWAWSLLRAQNQALSKDGQPIGTEEENLAEMRARFDRFETVALPVLTQLGIA